MLEDCLKLTDTINITFFVGKGKTALLTSTNPLKLTADWQCQNTSCKIKVTAAEIMKLHREVRTAKMNLDQSTQLSDYKEFLDKQLGPKGLLHSTSTYILQVKIFLIFNILGHTSGYLLKGTSTSLLIEHLEEFGKKI